jgi:hypothetical protein
MAGRATSGSAGPDGTEPHRPLAPDPRVAAHVTGLSVREGKRASIAATVPVAAETTTASVDADLAVADADTVPVCVAECRIYNVEDAP